MRSLTNFYRLNRAGQTPAPIAQPGRVTGPDKVSERTSSLAKAKELGTVADPLTRA